jgi:PAS domain S-box-containing protein
MYKQFFEFSSDLLCMASPEGFFLKVNNFFSKTLGYSAEDLISKPFLEFVHLDDVEKTLNSLKEQGPGKELSSFENRYKHKNRTYITLSWSSCFDTRENTIYAIAKDVTHLRDTENQLKQITHSLTSYSIVARTNSRGVITEVNQKFCDISGYSEHELIGNRHNI